MSIKTNNIALLLLAWLLLPTIEVAAAEKAPRYRFAACDWMMLKRQKLGEFALAKEIGADGVEMDMGPLGKRVLFDNKMRSEAQANHFKRTADSLGIVVPSVAMSGFFAQSFVARPNYRALIADCLNTMARFGSQVAFLPLGGSGRGWQQPGAEHDTLVARLRVAGKMAQRRGMVIGLRTGMGADYDIALLKEVGSKAVKVYYNFQDAADAHRDICKELRKLGRRRIAQIHASNTDSVNLRYDTEIDLKAIRRVLDDIGWKGWLVVERSRDVKHVRDTKRNFGNNIAYLKEVFRPEDSPQGSDLKTE